MSYSLLSKNIKYYWAIVYSPSPQHFDNLTSFRIQFSKPITFLKTYVVGALACPNNRTQPCGLLQQRQTALVYKLNKDVDNLLFPLILLRPFRPGSSLSSLPKVRDSYSIGKDPNFNAKLAVFPHCEIRLSKYYLRYTKLGSYICRL
ncbi:hypothetical protein TRIATDRAFT_93644 [Trichoderma atroviride IMI 206040]|uniref:Uncharacterized protein n=1 Tax=Hypocrea atroviridis (strain ATCC 20476 / IMI 206040) TaxID=452589 RepID=G9NL60_HYPAI|nr:uncharacterized protein TRIATDRAFT_93644 [Trichoderma atroviride IMI 206040]EHK48627.1 hypothetical protein TRIATDRAFT_93644 [Trichoderma atroviride IMI 206040]